MREPANTFVDLRRIEQSRPDCPKRHENQFEVEHRPEPFQCLFIAGKFCLAEMSLPQASPEANATAELAHKGQGVDDLADPYGSKRGSAFSFILRFTLSLQSFGGDLFVGRFFENSAQERIVTSIT